jgi:hypothetical protein
MAKLVPINYVSTAKQDLFDIIIGQKIPEDAVPHDTPFGPTFDASMYLVKGDYETIYKMMVNREMIFCASVKCYDDGRQYTNLLPDMVYSFIADKTVGRKPVIECDSVEDACYIDHNNIVYLNKSDIPFDGKDDSSGNDSGDDSGEGGGK